MKHSLILWISSILLAFIAGYIHSGTSEYYPVSGTIGIDEQKVSYKFDKLFNDKGNYRFIIRTDNPDISGVVKWKKEKDEKWNSLEMKNAAQSLITEIPGQKAGVKIFYYAEIQKDEKQFIIPGKPVSLLFQGYVPSMISFLSNFALFGGLLLSFRTGLEFFNEKQRIKKLTLFTAGFFFVYTIAVTPLKKSYELDAINKNVIPLSSLSDLHSILLFLLWTAAMIIIFKIKNPQKTALIFSILTLFIFLFIRS